MIPKTTPDCSENARAVEPDSAPPMDAAEKAAADGGEGAGPLPQADPAQRTKDDWEPILRERIGKAAVLGALAAAEQAIQGTELILASPTCQKGIETSELKAMSRVLSDIRLRLRQTAGKLN